MNFHHLPPAQCPDVPVSLLESARLYSDEL